MSNFPWGEKHDQEKAPCVSRVQEGNAGRKETAAGGGGSLFTHRQTVISLEGLFPRDWKPKDNELA